MTSANSYTVYNNKTDELVILDGTSKECAEAMGITVQSFYSYLSKSKKGIVHWYIAENRKKWRNKRIEQIGKMRYQKHMKIKDIAQKFGITKTQVYYDLKKYKEIH